MPEAFIDTTALIALANKSDHLHERAVAVRRRLSAGSDRVVTSQWVCTELLNSLAAELTRSHALRLVDSLFTSPRVTVIKAAPEPWLAALDLYRRRRDKEWSLVDCTSILICEERGIRQVFTNDRHFTQAGLEILLP
jgi:predicted nucleic acid-binding protein